MFKIIINYRGDPGGVAKPPPRVLPRFRLLLAGGQGELILNIYIEWDLSYRYINLTKYLSIKLDF
jgi:hypothetical protein